MSFIKDEKGSRAEFLKRKWGFENSGTNEALEKTHQTQISMFLELRDRYNGAQLEHIQEKLQWEQKWRERKTEAYPT